jgi:hypothetical protein
MEIAVRFGFEPIDDARNSLALFYDCQTIGMINVVPPRGIARAGPLAVISHDEVVTWMIPVRGNEHR